MHRLVHVAPLMAGIVAILLTGSSVTAAAETAAETAAKTTPDDFRWMDGVNYVASYGATDVEMWLHYDHDVIDR